MLNKNYSDSPVSGVTTLNLPRAILNFEADFRKIADEPTEAKFTNLKSPLHAPETFRIGRDTVRNVYAGSQTPSTKQSLGSEGISIVCQLTNSVSDVVDGIETILPLSTHVVFKFPKHSAITAELLQEQLSRLVSGLYDTGSKEVNRLEGIMRGSLLPSDI